MTEVTSEARPVTNCCNGRVGRSLIEQALQDERFREFVLPTGVQLIRQATEAGAVAEARPVTNCCNGRVGRSLEDIAAELGGAD